MGKIQALQDLTGNDVYVEAKKRIRHALTLFDKTYIAFSGGKDSLVVLRLLDEIYKEDGIKEKINVIFRDEEVIPDNVIEFVRKQRDSGNYNFKWFCVKMKSNKYILGKTMQYIQRDDTRENMREKEKGSIQTEGLFDQYSMDELQTRGDKGMIGIFNGIRTDESLVRLQSVMVKKDLAYIAKSSVPNVKLIKPVYDWKEQDIFKYLYDNKMEYCNIYDTQFINREPLRVSTPLHSESAKTIGKNRTKDPQFYNKILNIFPEMKIQEMYFSQLNRNAVFDDYYPTPTSLVSFIKLQVEEAKWASVFAKVRSALNTRQKLIAKTTNFGGYPYLHIYKYIEGGSYKRNIMPKLKPTGNDVLFEKKREGGSTSK